MESPSVTNQDYCANCFVSDNEVALCCDGCPRIFCLGCLGYDEVPEDAWYCPVCTGAITLNCVCATAKGATCKLRACNGSVRCHIHAGIKWNRVVQQHEAVLRMQQDKELYNDFQEK